jgi:hypothetical protein
LGSAQPESQFEPAESLGVSILAINMLKEASFREEGPQAEVQEGLLQD